MQKVRKAVLIMLIVGIVFTVFAGCSQKKDNEEQSSKLAVTEQGTSGGDEVKGSLKEKLVISWLGNNQRGFAVQEGTVIEQEIEKRFNVDLKPVGIDYWNEEQKNILFATGDMPDFILNSDIPKLAREGLIREVTKDMMTEFMPKLTQIVDELSPQGMAWDNSSFDEKLYGIPTVSYAGTACFYMSIRKDWMDALGVVKIPETIEELEQLFLLFRNNDPDGNNVKDTYAITNLNGTTLWAQNPSIFGAYDVKMSSWRDRGGRLEWDNISSGYKEALKLLAKWYSMGIIDKEYAIDTRDIAFKKFAESKVGSFETNPRWQYPAPDSPYGMLLANKPDADLAFVKPVKGPGGFSGTRNYNAAIGWTGSFGNKTSDEKVIRIMQIMEAIYSDNEMYKLVTYGLEGQHYDMVDGAVVRKAEFSSPEAQSKIGVPTFGLNVFASKENTENDIISERRKFFDFGWEIIDRAITDVFWKPLDSNADVGADVNKIETEFFFKAITNEIDVEKEWDKYVDGWMKAGGERLTAEANEKYAAMKKQ